MSPVSINPMATKKDGYFLPGFRVLPVNWQNWSAASEKGETLCRSKRTAIYSGTYEGGVKPKRIDQKVSVGAISFLSSVTPFVMISERFSPSPT